MKQIEDKILKEIFDKSKEIPGYPDYRITKEGRVFSKVTGSWVEISVYKYRSKRGEYRPKVNLYGVPKLLYRLLAITYIPNPSNKPMVCHKDNNPMNSNLDNLYWGTQSENMKQCKRDGRNKYLLSSSKHPQSKLTKKQVIKIRESESTHTELAKKYGVSRRTIDRIIRREIYVEVQ